MARFISIVVLIYAMSVALAQRELGLPFRVETLDPIDITSTTPPCDPEKIYCHPNPTDSSPECGEASRAFCEPSPTCTSSTTSITDIELSVVSILKLDYVNRCGLTADMEAVAFTYEPFYFSCEHGPSPPTIFRNETFNLSKAAVSVRVTGLNFTIQR